MNYLIQDRENTMSGVYDFTATSLAGEDIPLKRFEGQVLLIVNTASACGFTPQYKGLQALHRAFHPRFFSVLGFPCNQFGSQEPGDAAQIEQFCSGNYAVTFPMFAKIDVNGNNAHPLFQYLKSEKSGLLGSSIKWNFTKFLVDRSGRVVGRHGPTTTPEGLTKEIEALL
jgi:glutathione peroxidase